MLEFERDGREVVGEWHALVTFFEAFRRYRNRHRYKFRRFRRCACHDTRQVGEKGGVVFLHAPKLESFLSTTTTSSPPMPVTPPVV